MANQNDTVFYATATPIPPPPQPNAPPITSNNTTNSTYSIHNHNPVKPMDTNMIQELKRQGYTDGLAKSLTEVTSNFPLRIWVVDNSGSMGMTDGHLFIPSKSSGSKKDMKMISCTRWKEIQDCVNYHVQLSALLAAPTSFRLLNHPGISAGAQQFDIATYYSTDNPDDDTTIPTQVDTALSIMSQTRPSGCTPLTDHIRDIHASIKALESSLNSEGKRVVVVLATDGLPTNSIGESNSFIKNQFVQSLRSLEGLPVWLVVRLSTDEEEVVEFYNSLDDQLELSMDVLDDFCGEAAEIYQHNPWLNYGLPLHRLREMGFHDRLLDMIDERPLTLSEIRDFCVLLFGIHQCDGLPDPGLDWDGFFIRITELLGKEEYQWNPMKKKMMPWIDLKKFTKKYGDGSGCIIS